MRGCDMLVDAINVAQESVINPLYDSGVNPTSISFQ